MCVRAYARIMRITDKQFIAAVDISADSSATAAAIKRLARDGRVIIADNEGAVRSIIIADGDKGAEIVFSYFSTAFVCRQINDNGFIII